MLSELRSGVRSLAGRPGFSILVIVVFALGLASATALFTVARVFLFEPLPFPQPAELVAVHLPGADARFSLAEYQHWKESSRSLEALAARRPLPYYGDLKVGGWTEAATVLPVSSNYFRVLGVPPQAGRLFLDTEGESGRPPAAVLSETAWKRRFQGDPSVIGSEVSISESPYLLVGVAADRFDYLDQEIDVWITLEWNPGDPGWEDRVVGVGRLRERVDRSRAAAELESLGGQIAGDADRHSRGLVVRSLQSALVDGLLTVAIARSQLLLLAAVSGLVLLLASATAALLMLLRGTQRLGDLAIRKAMGAGRLQLVWSSASESLMLAVAGFVLGLVGAEAALRALRALSPEPIPRSHLLQVDGSSALFALGLALLLGLISAAVPALLVSRSGHLRDSLFGAHSRASGGSPVLLTLALFNGVQVAMTTALIIGAALLVGSAVGASQLGAGLDSEKVWKVGVRLPENRYFGLADPPPEVPGYEYSAKPALWSTVRSLQEEVRRIPGVASGTAIGSLSWIGWRYFLLPGQSESTWGRPLMGQRAAYRPVGTDFFSTLGIAVVRGRAFQESDREAGEPVAIVDEAMAERYWPGRDPLGEYLTVLETRPPNRPRRIVGVVRPARLTPNQPGSQPVVYVPYLQLPAEGIALEVMRLQLDLLCRTAGQTSGLEGALRQAVAAVDPDLVVANVRTLAEDLEQPFLRTRFYMALFGTFALVSLLLGAIGIYGACAFAVRSRSVEIAIRLTLGARPADVVNQLVGKLARVLAWGAAAGVFLAWAFSEYLESLLFEVEATDVWSYLLAVGFVAAAALASGYWSSLRTTWMQPSDLLRSE